MKSFIVATLLICSSFACVLPATAEDAAPESNGRRSRIPEPKLIAKSRNFFLHGLKGFTRDHFSARSFGDGTTLTHTFRETGKMTWLYSSGDLSFPTVRMSFAANRILGITSDDNRIYLCVWGTGRVFDRLPQNLTLDKGSISVMVFQGVDGAVTQTFQIQLDKDLSKIVAEDNLGAGPFRLTENGITCFDLAFEFDKERLVPKK